MLKFRRVAWSYIVYLGIGFFFFQAYPVKGQLPDLDAKTLRGLKAISVLIESFDSEATQAGLDKNMIQTDVELRLRKAGVRVIDINYSPTFKTKLSTAEKLTGLKGEKAKQKYEAEFSYDKVMTKEEEELEELYEASATLYINVNVIRILEQQSPHFIYSLSAEVKQTARLERDTTITCYGAITWDKGSVGIAPADKMVKTTRDGVADLVDMFLNAYLSQNQK